MDKRDQGRHWLVGQRISTSPSRYQYRQPAPPDLRVMSAGPSAWQGMGEHQLRTPYPRESSAWQTLPETQYGLHLGTSSSQTSREKRRRRSSSLDEGDHRQGWEGEARGRDHYRPPVRRQRVEAEPETNWATRASSALPAERMITRQMSRSLSPRPHRTSQGGPSRLGGHIDGAPSGRRAWSPSDRFIHRKQEDEQNGSRSQNRDEPMRSVSPFLQQVNERESVGRGEGRDRRDYPSSTPRDRHASQSWDAYDHHPIRGRATEAPLNTPQGFGASYQQVPPHDHSATYNITNTGNVFMGTNYGTVYMESTSADDFMMHLAGRLKICVQADHMYYAPVEGAALQRGQCTPGTRIDILQGVTLWAINRSLHGELIYWLSGQAGAGKTTIAYTIAHQFESARGDRNSMVVLGASFFCSRQFVDTQSVTSIVRTIVYQLALRSKSFQAALKACGRFETVDHGPRSQFMGLLVEPWKLSATERLKEREPCYIIPIDALDELKGTGGTEFLATLIDVVEGQDLSGLKFFVTSRSDPDLVKRIMSFPSKQVCRLEEVPLDESSADIKLYLDQHLGQCTSPQEIQQLVFDAAGLFIYAATVVEYVKGRTVGEQKSLIQRLLSTSPASVRRPPPAATAKLDNLYLQILELCLVDPRDQDNLEMFQDSLAILHTFICTIQRTSTSIAVDLLNASSGNGNMVLDTGAADGVLSRLHAVLYSQGGLVMLFHKSFADFLFDESRSQRFFCHQEHHHFQLADGCFRIMMQQLRFNIAGITSSYQIDCNNPTLPASIKTHISASLRYACGNWSAHLALTPLTALDDLSEMVHEFLQLRILFWVESMSLLGHRGRCQAMLHDAQRCFLRGKNSAELISKLADAAAFAGYHSMSKAAISTPHLYLSSLATFSCHSAIVQNWRHQFGGIPGFISACGLGCEAMVACITLRACVMAVAVSLDGVNTAVGLADGSVQIWDLSTGEEVKVLKGHTEYVYAVAFSPDGTHIVSGSWDKSLWLWDMSTGEEVRVLKGHTSGVTGVAYSPDGTHVVSGSDDKSVRLWDVSTGEEVRVLNGHTKWVCAVAYSPDGTHVVSGSDDNSVRLWDVSTGEEVRVLNGHTKWVHAVAYSPDGTHVVSCSGDKSVRLWDVSTGEEVRVLKGHTSGVTGVAYSPDGTHIVSCSADKSVRVWDLSTSKVDRVLKGHTHWVYAVAYLPDGNHIVSGSQDKSLRVWDLAAKQKGRALKGHTSRVLGVACSPDGTCVVSGSQDKSVRVWDLSTGEEVMDVKEHTKTVAAVVYSPDGTHIASCSLDGSVRVWDVSTGEEVRALNGHTKMVRAVAYAPGGTHIVSGSEDKSVRVWDVSTGEEVIILTGHSAKVEAVAYSPDGTHIASGSHDKSVRVWKLSTGEQVRVLKRHTSWVLAVAYSPDGTHVVSGSKDNSVRVWNVSTGEEVMVLTGHSATVLAVAYSPDGTHIASGSDDKSIRVWNLSTRGQAMVLKGHTSVIGTVAYSPNGDQIVSGSDDKTVRVWNISPDHKARYLRQQDPNGRYTGWLLSPTDPSAHLIFVQPDLLLPDDSNALTIPASATPHLDFSDAKFGDRWAECHTPRPL